MSVEEGIWKTDHGVSGAWTVAVKLMSQLAIDDEDVRSTLGWEPSGYLIGERLLGRSLSGRRGFSEVRKRKCRPARS
jgi:hypothetical protein